METIVVGVDGSPTSLDALTWADGIAQRAGASLVAVRAGLPGKDTISPELYADVAGAARHELEAWCGARDLAVTPLPIVANQDPCAALTAVAHDHHADLLVVGAQGTTGLAGLLLGGVARHLAQHPPLPLAVVHAGPAAEIRHLVVGVDGSEGSLAAVRFCADLATTLGVPVTAVFAHEPFAEWVPATDPRSWQRQAWRDVREWAEPVRATDTRVEVVVDRDINPVAALTRAIDARPGSLGIVGTRGRPGLAGLGLGRVSLQLLHHTSVPVVIVPVDVPVEEA